MLSALLLVVILRRVIGDGALGEFEMSFSMNHLLSLTAP